MRYANKLLSLKEEYFFFIFYFFFINNNGILWNNKVINPNNGIEIMLFLNKISKIFEKICQVSSFYLFW
jgi:hypothetical protein